MKILLMALSLNLSMIGFASEDSIYIADDIDKNANKALIIKGAYAHSKSEQGHTNFGLKDTEKLRIRVLEINGVKKSDLDSFYARVTLEGYSPEFLRIERYMFFIPDFVSEYKDLYHEMKEGDEIILHGSNLNEMDIESLDGNRVIRLELGRERIGHDTLYGTYAINPSQLEKVEAYKTIKLKLEDTKSKKRTLTYAIVEITKE